MFTTVHFENIVPRLTLNRQGLDVLVRPLTDNSYDDRYAVSLGSPVPLKLNTMSRTYRAEQYPTTR
jgi:aromatic ring-cleaving dioxygenase